MAVEGPLEEPSEKIKALLDKLEPGDVLLLADRYYASYWLIAMLSAISLAASFIRSDVIRLSMRGSLP